MQIDLPAKAEISKQQTIDKTKHMSGCWWYFGRAKEVP